MRLIVGLLLAILCVSNGGANDRTTWLSSLAGVPIQLFDLQAPDVARNFRVFLSRVPMTNDRPVPGALIDDTVASLSFMKAATPADEPSYFVASYIHKTPFMEAPESTRERYLERYGEYVYPQQVCPVFIDSANASVPTLLSTASNLPTAWFDDVKGSADNFDRLFALTEVSHCGFIAREFVRPTVIPAGLGRHQLRTILEALGDFEAIAVFRGTDQIPERADEGDALFAVRLLGMFLLEKENPYTAIPGLLHEYRRIGVDAANRRLSRILESVRLAKRTVRATLVSDRAASSDTGKPLVRLAASLQQAEANGELQVDDELARTLIADLQRAVQLLQGDQSSVIFPRRGPATADSDADRPPLITLTGARTFLN